MSAPTIDEPKLLEEFEIQVLIPEVRRKTRSRRLRLGLTTAIVASGLALAALAALGAPPFSRGAIGTNLRSATPQPRLGPAALAASDICAGEAAALNQGFDATNAFSVTGSFATTPALTAEWSASPGGPANFDAMSSSPDEPITVCFLSGPLLSHTERFHPQSRAHSAGSTPRSLLGCPTQT